MPKYLYRNRPPAPGCQPDNWTERECWRPTRTHPSGGEHLTFHGSVTYEEPLPFKDVQAYDLWPVSDTERAEYVFWLEGDEGRPGGWLIESYMNATVDDLWKHANRGDTLAKAALVLKEEVG